MVHYRNTRLHRCTSLLELCLEERWLFSNYLNGRLSLRSIEFGILFSYDYKFDFSDRTTPSIEFGIDFPLRQVGGEMYYHSIPPHNLHIITLPPLNSKSKSISKSNPPGGINKTKKSPAIAEDCNYNILNM